MNLSIVYLTYRPGGYDMLVDSLRNQTIQDYELIIIDDYKQDRSELVKQYFHKNGVEVKHILRSKPPCFPELRYNFINAWNTGVLASTGDVILFLQDYTWFEPNCLERWFTHEKLYEDGYTVAGIAKYWVTEPPNVEKDFTNPLSLWEKPWQGCPQENGWADPSIWSGDPFEMFYVAVPYKILVEINGFPECFDCDSPNLVTTSFINKAREVGGQLCIDNGNMCEMINHRLWSPSSLWHSVKVKTGGSSELLIRENCFDLKKHRRGDLFWL